MGLLDSIDNLLGTRLGLLVNDPRAAIGQMNQQAGAFNQASLLAVQAERNAMNGRPSTPEQLAAKQMIDEYTRDLAMGFAGNIKPVGKTPYELAQEVAQKNAVEMLGLPANNTAMDRAKALGFDVDAYHMTAKDIKDFDLNMASPTAKWGKAIYATEDKSKSPFLSQMVSKREGSSGLTSMPIKARLGNVYEAEKYGAPLGQMSSEKLGNIGFNSARDGTQIAVFDPINIRSRFAAFDPARVNEPDLLAAGIPFGLLAGTNIEIPKKKEKRK
jgi:hypothetical protein